MRGTSWSTVVAWWSWSCCHAGGGGHANGEGGRIDVGGGHVDGAGGCISAGGGHVTINAGCGVVVATLLLMLVVVTLVVLSGALPALCNGYAPSFCSSFAGVCSKSAMFRIQISSCRD